MPLTEEFIAFQTISQRRLKALHLLAYQGELTKELKLKILTTSELSAVDELYNIYHSAKRSRASTAIEKGLAPLAAILWHQENVVPGDDAIAFINPAHKINSREEALAGARDILAERIRENREAKNELKNYLKNQGSFQLDIINQDHPELPDYKKFLNGPHPDLTTKGDNIFRILEAESKGILSLSIEIPQDQGLPLLERFFIKNNNASGQQVRQAMEDSYQRFILPYLEMEIRSQILEEIFQAECFPKQNSNKFRDTVLLKSKYLLVFPALLLIWFLWQGMHSVGTDGIKKTYYSDGQIMSISGYLDGKLNGSSRKFLQNGQIVLLSNYKHGRLDGENREYYDNGEWKTIKHYKAGQLEGLVKEYDQEGRLVSQVYYHKNKPVKK